jgi:DNA-binding Lrp family transcriptional regulator
LVQANVEDTRLGVPEYAVQKLGVEGIEIKWGQGAKDIGGEVKLPTLDRAQQLKNRGYIRTGRGFIDVTDKGLNALGVSTTPAFILLKVSPIKRIHVYDQIRELAVSRAFRIAGEVDALIIVERDNLDEILKKLYDIDGIEDTRSYVTIEEIK